MNSKNDLINIGEVYQNLLDNVAVVEEKSTKNVKGIQPGSFEVQKQKTIKDPQVKNFVSKPSGPAEADGFRDIALDPLKKHKKGDFYEVDKFSQVKVEKTESKNINTYMKSTFDKLYEDVMSGEDVLNSPEGASEGMPSDGTDHTETGEHDAEMGEEEDVVAKLQQAIELLTTVVDKLGTAEGEAEDVEGQIGDEEHEDHEAETSDVTGEATDIKELGDEHGKKLQHKKNIVGDTTDRLSKKSGSVGDGKINGGCDGKTQEEGTPLVNLKKGKTDSVKGKSNEVGGKIKAGQFIGEQ